MRRRSPGSAKARQGQLEAIVCGAGPAGLASGAMLQEAGLRTVILERGERLASIW